MPFAQHPVAQRRGLYLPQYIELRPHVIASDSEAISSNRGLLTCPGGRRQGVPERAGEQSLLDFFYVNTIMIIGGSRFA